MEFAQRNDSPWKRPYEAGSFRWRPRNEVVIPPVRHPGSDRMLPVHGISIRPRPERTGRIGASVRDEGDAVARVPVRGGQG
jgi:hypothetical protein